MALPEPAQGTQEEALPTVEPVDIILYYIYFIIINVELPAIYGEYHVLVPEYEYEYEEFLTPALRHHW